jgi:hypothetical protein
MTCRRVGLPAWQFTLALLCAAAGCKGSIEGAVYGTDDSTAVRVTGHPVFLLSTAAEVAAVLKSICPANPAEWSERSRAEHARLEQIAAAYGDSARDELALRRGGRRWTSLVRVMNMYRDSAAATNGRQPSVPGDLIEKLAINRVMTGENGRFVFPNLSPGSYLVATELRDEFRWVPVQVSRTKRTTDIMPRSSHSSCDVARGL